MSSECCDDSFCRSFCACVLCVTGGGSRRSNPMCETSKRYRTTEAPEGSATSSLNPPKRPFKKTATKSKEANLNLRTMPPKEFQALRGRNPYVNERAHLKNYDLFWSRQQAMIYHDVILDFKKAYVPVQWIDLPHLQRNREYFGEALTLIQQLGIDLPQ